MDFPPDLSAISRMSLLSMDWSRKDLRNNIKDEDKYDGLKFRFKQFHKALFTKCDLAGMKLVDCEIKNSVITDSDLEGCILFNCKIKDCLVEESKVEGETKLEKVVLKRSQVHCQWARDCQFHDCAILHSRILCSELFHSNIQLCNTGQSGIQSSKMVKCAAISIIVLNCQIENTSIEKSEIREAILVESSTTDCEITSSPLTLRRFPVEIRALIYKDVINTNLLAALRCDSTLYPQAIEMFRKRFPIIIRPGTAEYQSTIPAVLIQKIDRVTIRYSDMNGKDLDCKVVPKVFATSKAIVSICMDFTFTKFESSRFLDVVKNWPRILGTVKQFSVKFAPRRNPFKSENPSAEIRAASQAKDVWHDLDAKNILQAGDRGFKVKSKCIHKGEEGDDRWIWEAEEGRVLQWTNVPT